MYGKFVSVFLLVSRIVYGCSAVTDDCPLWHIKQNGVCQCGASINGAVSCRKIDVIVVIPGYCMTWDNVSQNVVVNRCLLSRQTSDSCVHHSLNAHLVIPTNVSGPELNYVTCKEYNRKGFHCRQCIDGYGPAAFSDSITCADCSKYRHLWILNLLFQLTMVTLMYIIVILFQIKGTSSPLNVIITYCQLFINAIKDSSGFYLRLNCFLNRILSTVVVSLFGIWNLDFLHFVIPPMCVSVSIKSINILLFDYIIAFFPLILTIFAYVGIELHDRNYRIIVYLTIPVKSFFRLFHRNWNPKTTILNTFGTFILLAYSKLIFVSINLLFAVYTYDSSGEAVLNSTVLLFDTNVKFFHSEHIPYAVLALSVIFIFVLPPPLLLLFYPTRFFRKLLRCCGFTRWDILNFIMDIFQGWYKDGTEGTRDYRSVSALYLLMRILSGGMFVAVIINGNNYGSITNWQSIGISHVFLGTFFLMLKPYKRGWMNHVDGVSLLIVGVLLLIETFDNQTTFIIGGVTGAVAFVFIIIRSIHGCLCIN